MVELGNGNNDFYGLSRIAPSTPSLLLWIVVKEWGFDVGNGVWCSGQAWVLAFSDVWGAVKPKSTENSRKLTGKSQRKIRKMVYENFSVNHFPKHACFSLSSLDSRLSLCSLSFSHWTSPIWSLGFAVGFATRRLSGAVGFATRLRRSGASRRSEASPIWGFAMRLRRSGDRNRDPPPLATVTHLEPVSLSHPGDRTVAELKISSRDPPPLASRDPPRAGPLSLSSPPLRRA
uniref:Uncharacterized protein n=1 Tax=Fagus sylvatica TaxID=28930 RepID=A0A2N9GWU3_FAGSY